MPTTSLHPVTTGASAVTPPASTPPALTAPAVTPSALADRQRLVVVGVGDDDCGALALDWALAQSGALDLVHLVRSYVPVRIPDCSWSPVTQARDARRRQAQRDLAKALQRVRATGTRRHIDGSVVAGLPADVLVEFSAIVDLLVLGEDRPEPERHQVARLLAHSTLCPLAVVPAGYDPTGVAVNAPVTLLVDTASIPERAFTFAYDEAVRRGSSLCVAQTWTALHEAEPLTSGLVAARQECLDAQLAAVHRVEQPVGIFSELLFDDFDDTVVRLRRASRVVVTASNQARMTRLTGGAPSGCCPVIVVPEPAGPRR